MKLYILCQCKYILIFLKLFLISCVSGVRWDNSVDLNNDFRMLWNIVDREVTFEVQVRTLGYIGLGFSRDGVLSGSDIAIGWVSQGQTYFQVSFFFNSLPLHISCLFICWIVCTLNQLWLETLITYMPTFNLNILLWIYSNPTMPSSSFIIIITKIKAITIISLINTYEKRFHSSTVFVGNENVECK